MMNNAMQAIALTAALIELSHQIDRALQQAQLSILQAQNEGRDLTDEELKALGDKRAKARSEWNKLAPGG